MSLGSMFDRITADVQAKLAAQVNVQALAVQLAYDLFYMPDVQFNRFLILYLQTNLQQMTDITDADALALYVRRIVATAVASPMLAALIEAKYLALFG